MKEILKDYIDTIRKTRLFEGLNDNQVLHALSCLNARIRDVAKGERVIGEGEEATFVGVILSGEIQTQKTDYDGNINIISKQYSPELIAAAAAYSYKKRLPFDVVAVCEGQLLLLDSSGLSRPCAKACDFHVRIVENMLRILAEKNVQFSQKIDILTKRTIREKILSYLYSASKKEHGHSFSINLNRKQMAEYLSINRSALSRELSKMHHDGIIDYNNNRFCLKNKEL